MNDTKPKPIMACLLGVVKRGMKPMIAMNDTKSKPNMACLLGMDIF